MKILKYILLLLVLIVVAGAIYVATLENNYNVKRTRTINAPAEVVYNKVNDYKNWPEWSPWLGQDPEAKLTYGATTSGEGASYSWKGDVVGEGNMETLSTAKDSISQKITFISPWESTSNVYWKFNPVENGTEVTWGMKGDLDFISKASMVLMGGMDKQIGPDYEKGLTKLDSVVLAEMQKYSVAINGITTHGGGYYLYQTTSCKIEEMPQKMAEMMPKVSAYAQKNNITTAGPLFNLYHKYDEENNAVIFSCAVPVTERVITDRDSGILTGMLQPFTALKTTLKGDYKNLKEAWETSEKHIAENNNIEPLEGVPAMEVYHNDPMNTPNPANLTTEIFVPVKEVPSNN
ncbi:SRPBCC family protein [Aureibaculum sp. 2210JD6-5]|uniref:SRPBCC family protein n=1 Tax=Aureibaculum sp. 2210JD6-5 TaxID=3103957 RepID=UPI002AACE82B|nr:SRPBCC family protein [Aureibaculum sp. 2210JD6-5]MDY7395767.1 SRPBCC family protein [Aureibaculum sp. 2210JD6-5]